MGERLSADIDDIADAGLSMADLMASLSLLKLRESKLSSDEVGDARLAGALSEFCDAWDKGLKLLTQDGDEAARGLIEAAGQYHDDDIAASDRIAEAARIDTF